MKKRRIAAVLVSVMLLSLAPVTAIAVDASQQYLFSLTAGVGAGTSPSNEIYAKPGDIISVYFTLTRTDIQTGSYPIYAVQEEIEFSSALFEIHSYPIFSDAAKAFQAGERPVNTQGNTRVLMNYVSAAQEGAIFPRELAVGSFTLRVKEGASGTTQITSKDYLMSNQNGSQSYQCSAGDIKVTFGEDPTKPKSYQIALLPSSGGGINTVPSGSATAGTSISLIATPQTGYTFREWTVTCASGAAVSVMNKNTAIGAAFLMPESNVSVSATFEKSPTVPEDGGGTQTPVVTRPHFVDVTETHWAYTYVEYMASLNFINGKTQDRFCPEDPVTRGEFVTILARMCGADLTSAYSGAFTDVNSQQYYAAAVDWAARAGITVGTGETAFSPDRRITRQEIAAMIVRYVQYTNDSLATQNDPQEFKDSADIAEYAKQAVSLMQRANIISGYDDGTFRPRKDAARAEAAKMLAVVYLSTHGS